MGRRNDTLDRVLTEFPPLIKHFADTRDLFADAVEALGRFSDGGRQGAVGRRAPTCITNLQLLQRPLQAARPAVAVLVGALKLMLTAPFTIDERAEGGPRRLHQRVADGRPDTQRDRQRVTHRHRCLGLAARARAVVGSRSRRR